MEKFNLNFQTDKVLELWHILSDKGYLCFDKITNVKVSVKKQKRRMIYVAVCNVAARKTDWTV